ncbi:DUF2141 domain-containing protein [Altererythrobacter arenosus]|uniref:DUF2141 domain-containing protein n=1 Tax=Altererythrobacter arenosus TaxID=3032592 RepID=A0ABY8FU89_9SPHN|nr:DUF2141 domain-containing protein [Altererythrobacter sp. CAU 1644]WFL78578.1 DUF2141 domain-containing protein [Altererythrobacter sp. CAU 1644]
MGTGAILLMGATPPQHGQLAVTVTDLRSGKGQVLACLTAKPRAFPDCSKDPAARTARVDADSRVELMFDDVRPGRYAVSLLHDENANGKADRVLGMMPKEGFGFSRDAPVRMGPPTFDQAAFEYAGEAKAMTIRMRYLL